MLVSGLQDRFLHGMRETASPRADSWRWLLERQAATSLGRRPEPKHLRDHGGQLRRSELPALNILGEDKGDASLALGSDGDRALPTGSSSDPLTRLSTISNPVSRRPRDSPPVFVIGQWEPDLSSANRPRIGIVA
jgi:hypothetical protein